MSYLKNLAGDLLSLEVNTIVKDNTTSSKMPSTKRYTLLGIADMYRDLLVTNGTSTLLYDESAKHADRDLLRWRFGGEYSFVEIYKHSVKAIEVLTKEQELLEVPDDAWALGTRISMLKRVSRNSSNLVGMFKARKKAVAEDGPISKPGNDQINEETGLFLPQNSDEQLAWNNDISLDDINNVADLKLAPDEIALIKKIWEIGTQQVLMQTVIQIDGDIANYMAKSFIELPEEMRNMVLNMHNESTESATRVWQMLFKTIGQLAGKAYREIFDSKS